MTDKDNQTLLICERCKIALQKFVCPMCKVFYGKDSQQSSDDKHS